MKPIVEQGSVEVELIRIYYDSPTCKVYVVQTKVKRPHVIATENERLVLAIYPSESHVSDVPTMVHLHELDTLYHTTIVEVSRSSAFVVSVIHPNETKIIYEN